jgi:hypothetical protein
MGFVVDEAALGQAFSEYYGFSCQSFHRLLYTHHHPSSSAAGTVGLSNSDSLPLHPKKGQKTDD